MKRFMMFSLLSLLFLLSPLFSDFLRAEIETLPALSNNILMNESPIKNSYAATLLPRLCYLLGSFGHVRVKSSYEGFDIGAQTILLLS